MTKVLLIGGEGYIGSKLKIYLTSRNIQVTSVDTRPSSADGSPHICCSFEKLETSMLVEFSHVILLAAHSSVLMCSQDPVGAVTNNLSNLETLLNRLDSRQVLIFASSGSVYDGVRDRPAIEEISLATPRNLYDLTKRAGEDLIRLHANPSVILRFGTVSGPSPVMRQDVVINKIVYDAFFHSKITISNGHVNRAILSIDDLCEAMNLLISMKNFENGSQTLNLASFNTSLTDLGTQVSLMTGASIQIGEPSGTYDFSMSIDKANRFLSYSPKDSLQTIVDKLVKMYRSV
jgi:UDP-glucose 4-epimerase